MPVLALFQTGNVQAGAVKGLRTLFQILLFLFVIAATTALAPFGSTFESWPC